MTKKCIGAALLAAVLLTESVSGLALSSSGAQAAQRDPSQINDRISAAASINEDMVELALAGETSEVQEKITDLRNALSELQPALSEGTYQAVGSELNAMEAAVGNNDMVGVALAAVEAYRTLENALDRSALVAPREVSMLDYSGFKLSALTAAATPSWTMIGAAASEASGVWKALAPQVQDTGLRDLMNSIITGLEDAVDRHDVAQSRFAAQIILDAVDVLEQHFARA